MRPAGLAVVTALVAGGCNAILGIDDLQLRDAGMDDIDAPDTMTCLGSFVKACVMTPTAPVTLSGTLDTGVDPRCVAIAQTNGPEICAIAGTQVMVTADTTVTGPRPLMLLATGSIIVGNRLDVGSKISGNVVGPGANSMLCATPVDGGSSATGGGAGGAGGSFITIGGNGGAGNGAGAGPVSMANPVQAATVLRGGCAGGKGGNGAGGGAGGTGGAGGGAVYLVARDAIEINAMLRASGAAGLHGGSPKGGAGAGGSGGMIVLEATTIIVSGTGAQVQANGGGGGEGTLITGIGQDGHDDRSWDMAPSGGSGGTNDGGNGGDGAFLALPAESANNGGGGGGGGAGGGGGGGGGGTVRYKGALTATAISPTPTQF